MLMEGDPFTLIEGMTIAGIAAGATKGFVYIRSEYPHAIATMKQAIAHRRRSRWLGKTSRARAELRACGAHRRRRLYLRRRNRDARKPRRQARHGAAQAADPGARWPVRQADRHQQRAELRRGARYPGQGGAFYKNYGMGRSRGTLPFQLAGNIKQGGLVEKAFGITLRQLIDDFGGGTASGRPVRAIQVGGPLGSYLPESQFDLPMDYETFAANGAMVGHGGIVVFDDTVDMAEQARFAMEFCAIESCGKCTPCRIGSTRGVEVIDKIVAGIERDKNLMLLDDLCQTMMDGSLCAMGGLTPMPVQSAVKHFPEDFDRPLRCA